MDFMMILTRSPKNERLETLWEESVSFQRSYNNVKVSNDLATSL